jgi:hypothetical protein
MRRVQIGIANDRVAGFAYPLFYSESRKLTLPVGIEEWARKLEDIEGPLMFEPGTRWSYGVSFEICRERRDRKTRDDKVLDRSRLGRRSRRAHLGPISRGVFPETYLRTPRHQKHHHVPFRHHESEPSTHAPTLFRW